jgi:hypothetical protein
MSRRQAKSLVLIAVILAVSFVAVSKLSRSF